jgi:hypothetical protein
VSLIGLSGTKFEIPETLHAVFVAIVALLGRGGLLPCDPRKCAITTERAAWILGMSRPFVVKLLVTGALGMRGQRWEKRKKQRKSKAYTQPEPCILVQTRGRILFAKAGGGPIWATEKASRRNRWAEFVSVVRTAPWVE